MMNQVNFIAIILAACVTMVTLSDYLCKDKLKETVYKVTMEKVDIALNVLLWNQLLD